jgi:hypothetical protein
MPNSAVPFPTKSAVQADLRGARLVKADLSSADFPGADLREAKLEDGLASDLTTWPTGFDEQTVGVVVAGGPWHRTGQPASGCRAHETSPTAAIGTDASAVSVGELNNQAAQPVDPPPRRMAFSLRMRARSLRRSASTSE